MVKKFIDYIKEDTTTSASWGSGTAVSGGATGSFTSAAGVNVGGYSSGSAFNTNSSSNGMGNVVSAQPSSIPGDVSGSQKGSGDIGTSIATYMKQPANLKRRGKNKKNSKMEQNSKKIDDLYVVKFTEFDGVKNIKENSYTPPTKTVCNDCGMEVEDCLKDMLGHVYLKHWAKPNTIMKDEEARVMAKRFFHEINPDE